MSNLVVLSLIGELYTLSNHLGLEAISLEADLGSKRGDELLLQVGQRNSVLGSLGTSETGNDSGEIQVKSIVEFDG